MMKTSISNNRISRLKYGYANIFAQMKFLHCSNSAKVLLNTISVFSYNESSEKGSGFTLPDQGHETRSTFHFL